MDKPKEGERWHVQINKAQCLSTLTVAEITDKTVLLKDHARSVYFGNRYLLGDVEFIERAD